MKEKFALYPSVPEGHTPGGYAVVNGFQVIAQCPTDYLSIC
jgi:hypothetical protein